MPAEPSFDPSRFACPKCRGALTLDSGSLACSSCGRRAPRHDGVFDFCHDLSLPPSLAQRSMELPAVAAVYEHTVRPIFTRIGSPIRYDEEVEYLRRHFHPAEGPVLDLACGTGRYARKLASMTEPRRVIALDLSKPMLMQARRDSVDELAAGMVIARASAQELPFPDASLGAANCFGALHLFPDPAGAIGQIGRVLRPGGTFTCLTAGRIQGPARLLQSLFGRATKFHFFADDELRAALTSAGLEVVDLTRRSMVTLFAARRR